MSAFELVNEVHRSKELDVKDIHVEDPESNTYLKGFRVKGSEKDIPIKIVSL